jgi:hypothetical protein
MRRVIFFLLIVLATPALAQAPTAEQQRLLKRQLAIWAWVVAATLPEGFPTSSDRYSAVPASTLREAESCLARIGAGASDIIPRLGTDAQHNRDKINGKLAEIGITGLVGNSIGDQMLMDTVATARTARLGALVLRDPVKARESVEFKEQKQIWQALNLVVAMQESIDPRFGAFLRGQLQHLVPLFAMWGAMIIDAECKP